MAEFTEMVLCGYQGWFAAGDDNTLRHWSHWSKRGVPGPGNSAFELYPDVREYPADALRETGYGDLGNGNDSLLFGSERTGVVGRHFKWMQDHGIDGVALQRFVLPIRNQRKLDWRNKVASKVRRQAEAHHRSFYVMYDISGADWPSQEHETLAAELRDDFDTHIRPLTNSAAHARQDGRPVVAIWGFGFEDRRAEIADALATVEMLRNAFGCYVVLGVPYHWREESGDSLPGWLPVYESADMLVPWSVGRYKTVAKVQEHALGIWAEDKAFCDARGIGMQRVIFPGFAWSNLKGKAMTGAAHALSRHAASQDNRARINAIPRDQGDFLWGQAFQVAQVGVGAFVAMFDEYDEATAIAKAATDASMIPGNEYFLTLDADGEHVRADHYLWLTGELTKMIKNPAIATQQRPDRPAAPNEDHVPVAPAPAAPEWTGDEAEVVVKHAYLGLLAREADDGGLVHFAYRLMDGDTTIGVCRTLANSEEFDHKNEGLSTEEIARRLYTDLLKRRADEIDSDGLAATIAAVETGRIASRTAAMLRSDEFRNRVLNAD